MKKFWKFEIISIIGLLCFCIFSFSFTKHISECINIIFLVIFLVAMLIAICKLKIKSIHKVGLVFVHLLIHAIVFYIYLYSVIEFDWGKISMIG
jgi:hypothetical protein